MYIFGLTIAQFAVQSLAAVLCAFYVVSSTHGHPQRGLQQKNKIMADSVKSVYVWTLNNVFSIKIVTNI